MFESQITKIHLEHPATHTQHMSRVMLSDGKIENIEYVANRIQNGWQYYYTIGAGQKAYVEIAHGGKCGWYIRTQRDNTMKDNLLSLPQF